MRKAFTLIELLVVIAIIAILAAILFPVFAQAKAAAKKTAALSNTKQLILGIIMYTGDYDDTYYEHAQGMSTGTQGPNSLIWGGWMYPYTKNAQIEIDPAATNPVQTYNNTKFTGEYFVPVDYQQLSIGYNTNFTSDFDYACSVDFSAGTPSCSTFFNANQFQYPAQTLVFASSFPVMPGATAGAGFWVSPNHNIDVPNGIFRSTQWLHNVGFMEGHAKSVKATTLLVSDQVDELNPASDHQCVNYNTAHVYWDPTAPDPTAQALCEGHGIR